MNSKRKIGNLLYSIWDVLFIKVDFIVSTLRSVLSLNLQGCPPGTDFATSGKCSFKARNSGSIKLGQGVRLLAAWRTNRVGISNPVLLQTFEGGQIDIGDFSGGSSVVISSRAYIYIGRNVNLGGNVRIFDHDFHAIEAEKRQFSFKEQEYWVRKEPIYISDDVFVGTNSIILKGAKIGPRTIVAAGSVVFRGDYPSDVILEGNPAAIRYRNLPQ
jgi:acetyltransferase-like isoleucine patch superfamily enzyme